VTLSERLLREVERLLVDFKNRLEQGIIDRFVEEERRYGYKLRRDEPGLALDGLLNRWMDLLWRGMSKASPETLESQKEKIEKLILLIDRADKWDFELRKEEAQNIMHEILEGSFGDLEMSWWGWGTGTERPIPPNLVALAEKLNFNIDRFSKIG